MRYLLTVAVFGWLVAHASFYAPNPRHVKMWGTQNVTAHRTLKPGTKLEVVNLRNGKRVLVTVVGWGPAKWTKRDLDLSRHSFRAIEFPSRGVARVRYRVVGK